MGASIAKLQDQYLNSMLRRAVDRSDPRETEYYLRAGADPNAFDDTVPLLLLAASKWNEEPSKSSHPNFDCCRLLLNHGADIDIDISTSSCPPALVLACAHNHIRAVRLLIERGADVNVFHRKERRWDTYCERTGSTPLFAATGRASFSLGSTEVMSFLLDQGADPNVLVDEDTGAYYITRTCLGVAVHWKHFAAVKLLLEHGAHVEPMDSGMPVLVHALDWPPLVRALDRPLSEYFIPASRNFYCTGSNWYYSLFTLGHREIRVGWDSQAPENLAQRTVIYREDYLPDGDHFDVQIRILELLLSYGASVFEQGSIEYTIEPCVPLTLVRKLKVSGEKYGFLDDDLPEETSDVRRAARIKAIFDATVLVHCIVASRRYAYASSARRRVFDNPDLPNEVAGFLGLKATRR